MKIEEFSNDQFQVALKRNIRALTRGKVATSKPQAILLGGQSGAGKTTIHRIKQKEFQGNIIIIDGDSYRSQHPNYLKLHNHYHKESVLFTQVFASQMVEKLIDEISQLGFHMLIEGTLRAVDIPRQTTRLLKKRDYDVSLCIMATKPELSYLSTLIRYERLFVINSSIARATPKSYHDSIVNNLVQNLEILENEHIFKQIQVYKRDCSCVYDSNINQSEQSAANVLENALFGKWNQFETEIFKQDQLLLENLRIENRNTTQKELIK